MERRKKRTFNNRNISWKGRKKRAFSTSIDISRFVNRSAEKEETVDYVSQNSFSDFDVDTILKKNIEKKGYQSPTEIQDKTIPLVLQKKDVIGVANTGTGKTVAFLLPFADKVMKNRKEKVFIITPTRELALQIHGELLSLTNSTGIRAAVCVGGCSIGKQIQQLKRNPQFVIGTPGRLKDLVMRKKLFLESFRNIVLDEADRMLDMGFIDDIKFLMSKITKPRQTLLFSATIPKTIEGLINGFLENPVKISVKQRETAANVDQDILYAKGEKEKLKKLCSLLEDKIRFQKVLIFGKTKIGVEKLSNILDKEGFRATSIHGDKAQAKRQHALGLFKKGSVQVLVATDVAARGLDISNVTHVINFDIPATYDDYVHRIGRTGRANKKGVALTFVN